jgi:asparagine synthase (glutamine-hydrolysing)
MGVRLFYYARIGNCLVFSNSLNTVLLHPAVSNRLNDLAVADFLVLGANQDPEATIFADVRRMLPAHLMLCSQGELRIQRYWELPIDPPLRFRRRRDYTEHFLDLFRTVMRDRLPTDRVGILMSGGLDSAGMAAIAKNLAQSESTGATGALDISAYTVVLDWLVPDRERYYSGKVASHLGIPIQYFPADDGKLFEALHSPGLDRYPDPSFMPIFGQDEASQGPLAAMARRGIRVGLYGEGPDNAMVYEWKSYVRHQLRHGSTGLLLKELAEFPFAFKEIPFVSRFSVRAKRSPEQPPEIPVIPSWLDRGFVSRLGLEERYNHLNEQAEAGPRHPVRPKSHGSFDVSAFQSLFEKFDTGVLGLPIEVRHPFMDIRMLRYLLAVPVIPWCREKYLIRQALRSYLPGEVIARPKQGLQGFPSWERWKRTGVRNDLPLDLIVNYVDVAALKTIPIDSRFLLAQFNLAAMLGFFLAQRKAEV